jgi:DNA polymerase-3 subunit delta'
MNIIGNQKAIKLLDRIATSGKIASAYLFVGPESVGKFTTALNFATKIIAGDGKINSDLIVIAPEIEPASTRGDRSSTRGGEKKGISKKLDIKIETIRELQHKLSLTSTGGKYKAVIIDSAEKLNRMAQNALLKTLEEPNEKVVLILVAQNEKKILPTIASRCQKIRFGVVADTEIAMIIPSGNKNKQEIIFWSLGRPGIALNLSGNLAYRQETLQEFRNIFSKNLSEKFAVAESWTKDTAQLQKKMNLWLVILREAMLNRKDRFQISPDKALILSTEIAESMRLMKETNSNARLIMENLFLKF